MTGVEAEQVRFSALPSGPALPPDPEHLNPLLAYAVVVADKVVCTRCGQDEVVEMDECRRSNTLRVEDGAVFAHPGDYDFAHVEFHCLVCGTLRPTFDISAHNA
jgi:predicted RNA-binding Zn-ribbon protein involved in translation (DUF1610 family)